MQKRVIKSQWFHNKPSNNTAAKTIAVMALVLKTALLSAKFIRLYYWPMIEKGFFRQLKPAPLLQYATCFLQRIYRTT